MVTLQIHQVSCVIFLIVLSISPSVYSQGKSTAVKVTQDIEANYTTINENAGPNEAPQFTFSARQGTKKYPGIITITGTTRDGNKTLKSTPSSNVVQTVRTFQERDEFTTTVRVSNVTTDENTLVTVTTTIRVKRFKKGQGYAYEEHAFGKIETKSAQESTDNCQRHGAYCEFSDECCGGGNCVNQKCSSNVRCIAFGGQCNSPRDCCDKDATCSNKKCTPPPPPCKSFGGQCSSPRDCCDKGAVCSNGQCSPPPPPCAQFGGKCSSARDCCAKDGICSNGQCYPPPPPCKALGGQCSSVRDCCDKSGVCSNGQCSPPPPPCKETLGDTCSIPDDCCGTWDCVDGKCTDESHKPGNAFAIRWTVKDEQSRNDFGQNTDSDGEVVKGEYRTLMADGRTQVVTYTADWKNGYNAKYTYV